MSAGGVERIYRVRDNARQGLPRHIVEQQDGVWRALEGDVFGAWRAGDPVERTAVQLLAPVQPSKIVAVGLNYRDHAAEMKKPLPDEPLIFLKPSTAVIGPGATIRVPPALGRVDQEAELALVIGRPAYRVPASRAREHILGLTCFNDVTSRDFQRKDVQYTRAKGFDTFAPIGPCIATGLDAGSLDVEAWVNGVRRQASNTRELIFTIERLVEFVTAVMTLLPGDVIATGTPSGVGPIAHGDQVTIRIEGIGDLTNPVEYFQ